MTKNRKLTVAGAVLAAAFAIPALGRAAPPNPLDLILARLQGIANAVTSTASDVSGLKEAAADRYVPFTVTNPGGLCDSGPSPSSNPLISFWSGEGSSFVVRSVLIKRGFMNPVDFAFLSLNGITLGGTIYDTRTSNLFFPSYPEETGVEHAADILGTPVRTTGSLTESEPTGGNVPHELVIEGDDVVTMQLFCRSDVQDFDLTEIRVSGWKRPSDTILVEYTPGT